MSSLSVLYAPSDLAARLKSLRLEQNRTQAEVSEAVGLSRRALSALESGTAPDVRLQTLLKLLRYFKCQLMVAPESPVPTLTELDFERRRGTPSLDTNVLGAGVARERATGKRGSRIGQVKPEPGIAGRARARRKKG